MDHFGVVRQLSGNDPTNEQIKNKLRILEEFLNQRKESHLQKEIILQELDQILVNFKKEAEEKRYYNLKTVSKCN